MNFRLKPPFVDEFPISITLNPWNFPTFTYASSLYSWSSPILPCKSPTFRGSNARGTVKGSASSATMEAALTAWPGSKVPAPKMTRGNIWAAIKINWIHQVQIYKLYEIIVSFGGPYQFPVSCSTASWTQSIPGARCSTNAYRWIIAISPPWTRKKEGTQEKENNGGSRKETNIEWTGNTIHGIQTWT